jgi:outer membrane protein assembly factor BamA
LNRWINMAAWSAMLASEIVCAQSANLPEAPERRSDIPASELTEAIGDGGLQIDDSVADSSMMQRIASTWPADLVIAPIPGRSPQLGWTLALGAMYFISGNDAEKNTPPSVLGAYAMWSDNGSYIYGGGANLHFLGDRLRVKAAAGYADLTYRYYGKGDSTDLGFSVDIQQQMPLYLAQAMWNVWDRLYIGVGFLGGEVDTRLKIDTPGLPIDDPTIKVDVGAWRVPLEWDSRDHTQFPRNGWYITGMASMFRDSAGSDFDADVFKLAINHYYPMREGDVLASRAFVRAASDDAPFFLLSSFGGKVDLRGYPSGRYRDAMLYAIQTEYRWKFSDKWIFTGFAGVGEVAEDFGDFGKEFLPSAGVGARFLLSQKHKVSLAFDIAHGKNGTEYYFGVGEAF